MQDDFLTLNEVAKYLKIPKSTIYKLSQKGQLPSCKVGKQLRFRKASLHEWLSARENVKNIEITGRSLKQKRILLIEDDPLVLKAVSKFLKAHGYILETAETGLEALAKTKKTNFDLLITDIRMPGMSGIETIKKIREYSLKNKQPQIPEIIITGYADSEAQREAEKLGITDYIYKPFATVEFLKSIEKKIIVGRV